jgi:hypothetical protein
LIKILNRSCGLPTCLGHPLAAVKSATGDPAPAYSSDRSKVWKGGHKQNFKLMRHGARGALTGTNEEHISRIARTLCRRGRTAPMLATAVNPSVSLLFHGTTFPVKSRKIPCSQGNSASASGIRCYLLHFGNRIQRYQQVGPDLFPSSVRALTRARAAVTGRRARRCGAAASSGMLDTARFTSGAFGCEGAGNGS